MTGQYFVGKSFDSEKERNQYVFKNKNGLVQDQKGKQGSFILWGLFGGFFLGLIFGLASSSWIIFFIFLIGPPIFFSYLNSSKINKIEGYAKQHENFLIKLEKDIRNDILKRFENRYLSENQKLEHVGDLINLINHKKTLNLNEDDGIFLLGQYTKEYNIDLFSKEISKLKNKSVNNLAKLLIDLSPDSGGSVIYTEIFDYFCEVLERKNIKYDPEILRTELTFEFKRIKATNFEKKLSRDPDKRITVEEIARLNGFEFEQLIGDLFRKAGYKVEVTKKTGDQGADIIIEKDGVATAVQTKKYNGSVGNTAVQEVVAALKYYDCDKAMVITTGHFTKGAFELASRNGVQLIDKNKLDDLFDEIL